MNTDWIPTAEQWLAIAACAVAAATAYQQIEPRLRRLADETESPIDNKILAGLGYVARLVLIVLSPLRLVPGLSKPTAAREFDHDA